MVRIPRRNPQENEPPRTRRYLRQRGTENQVSILSDQKSPQGGRLTVWMRITMFGGGVGMIGLGIWDAATNPLVGATAPELIGAGITMMSVSLTMQNPETPEE